MSDAEPPGEDPGIPDAGDPASGDGTDTEAPIDPVDVFAGGDLDLRSGADDCYKCSTCDTNCPVADVDENFPGPKFQGPEQWRLKRKGDHDVDPSIMDCSNCMSCDAACPSDVPLSQMHNQARAEFVAEQRSRWSPRYWRDRILSNYRRSASIASRVPRLANALANSRLLRVLGERLLGVTAEREFPEFADQTFRAWWRQRGGAHVPEGEKRVAYFHGCYANYNTPEVARATVRVFEHFGYHVAVPEQGCSGTPMFANGMLPDARREAEVTVPALSDLIEEGYDVICSCTSCSLSLRQEYPELFSFEGIDDVATNTYEAMEYLRIHEDLEAALGDADADGEVDVDDLAYHAPCHARTQGLDRQARQVLGAVDGLDVEDVGDSCSGISGTYGWKAEKYDTSMAIGAEMFEELESAAGDTGLTECPTCAMQMEHGTGYEVRHPLEVLADALDAR